ncbi:MAG TPA: YceI family protein [Rudaea sp.]|nr:YceI family protein [Rudaea sp.]
MAAIRITRIRHVTRTSAFVLVLAACAVQALPITYEIDPEHTHPAFEADHFGMSSWRGMFRTTHGTVVLDTEHGTGAVDVTVDVTSVEFGHDKLNAMAVSSTMPPILEATKFPEAHYVGTLRGFFRGAPRRVDGTLTLHGVTKPLSLKITKFRCMPEQPIVKREVCGADAVGHINREDFGITTGKRYGFDMNVDLRVQVEAMRVTETSSTR